MRPKLRFLSDDLIRSILDEAREVLRVLGVEVNNPEVLALLGDHGAEIDALTRRARIPGTLVDKALSTALHEFRLFDVTGRETHHFAGDKVHFTPGSAALNLLDSDTGTVRRPLTADYVRYCKVVARCTHIAAQSTAMIPADVPERISDSYRLYLGLLHCAKPVVTGAFTSDAFGVMKDLQVIVRGNDAALREKPLTIFSCCPTAPLKWSHETSQNLLDCGRSGIPVEYISMPLTGFVSPVTLVGSLVQHTAETLSGVVISQLAAAGAPALYGGSPAAFDVRYETTPMGAAETMMLDCAYSEIGKFLGFPTQAYTALSDAKLLDAQAGMEDAMGAVLAVLSGINSVSGPGMLDFESCLSIEKLVLDNELCGMALRLARGIEPREDFPAVPIFEELLRDGHLLIAKHSRKYLKTEHHFPGPVIDRAQRGRWHEEGSTTILERCRREIARAESAWEPPPLPEGAGAALTERMTAEARCFGMDILPALP